MLMTKAKKREFYNAFLVFSVNFAYRLYEGGVGKSRILTTRICTDR